MRTVCEHLHCLDINVIYDKRQQLWTRAVLRSARPVFESITTALVTHTSYPRDKGKEPGYINRALPITRRKRVQRYERQGAQANAGQVTDVPVDIDADILTFTSLALNNATDFHNNYFGAIANCGNTSVAQVVIEPANFAQFKEIINNLAMTFKNPLFDFINGAVQGITIPT
jgi:hypothetical protein